MSALTDTLVATLRDLIDANYIIHHHGVVDGYGHISIRHPNDPSIYIMSGYMAPAIWSPLPKVLSSTVSGALTLSTLVRKKAIQRASCMARSTSVFEV